MGRSKVGPFLRACSSVACFPVKNPFCPCSLEENDKIKSEINPRKINEPKTPYHGPMEEEPGCGEIALHNRYLAQCLCLYTCSVPDTRVTLSCLGDRFFCLQASQTCLL